MGENVLKNKSYHFAIRIVRFYKFLVEKKKEFVIFKTNFEMRNFNRGNG